MPKETILVVDDEEHIIELARMYLEQEGFTVRGACDGAEALENIRTLAPALIVLDLMLPEVDGWEVCREIRTFSQVPILVLSAVVDTEGVMRALEEGANDYLVKPVPAGVLVSNLRRLIEHAQDHLEAADPIRDE